MERHSRNNGVAGVGLLVGAALIGFVSTQAWATGSLTIPFGRLAGLSPGDSLGFDVFLTANGQYGDVQPVILGGAAFLAVAALLLIVTRVRGLGLLWRVLSILTVIGLGILCASGWSVIGDPSSVIAEDGSVLRDALGGLTSAAESTGLLDIGPGLGLWLLTIGCGVAAISVLIPAIRRTTWQPVPGGPPGPGWYPDQADPSVVRWFDGARWTEFTQPRR